MTGQEESPTISPQPLDVEAAPPRGSLWRNGNFMKLWSGETLSQLGSQISTVAIPLTAITVFGAGPGMVGLLATAQFAPILIVSPFAGVWLDTHRRRPVLIAAHLGRAALIGLVPLTYLLHLLTVELLVAVAFVTGSLTAIFDIGYIAYLPQLVTPKQLTDANAKLESTYSIAGAGGPGLGGVLVQILTAPLAILADTTTYLIAGILSMRIRHTEDPPQKKRQSPWPALHEGLTVVWRHRILRPMVVQSAVYNLLGQVALTLFLLYGVRHLRLSPGTLGIILSVGSIGGLIGALLASRAARLLGAGRVIVWSMALSSVSLGAIPAASGPVAVVVVVLVAGLILNEFGLGIFNVHSLSVRAQLIPSRLLGRATASWRLISHGTLSLNGILASVLGELFGVRAAIAIAIGVLTVCCCAFMRSSVGSLATSDMPDDRGEGERR